MTARARRVVAAVLAGMLLLAALMVAGAPSAAADESPIVVETAPAAPDVSAVCARGEHIDMPDDPPWTYEVHWDPQSDSGVIFAVLPESHILPNGSREWVTVGWAWEIRVPGPACAPSEPAPAVPDNQPELEPELEPSLPDELAATGPSWALLPLGILGAAGVLGGAGLIRNHNKRKGASHGSE